MGFAWSRIGRLGDSEYDTPLQVNLAPIFLDDKSCHVTVASQLAWYSRKIRGIPPGVRGITDTYVHSEQSKARSRGQLICYSHKNDSRSAFSNV